MSKKLCFRLRLSQRQTRTIDACLHQFGLSGALLNEAELTRTLKTLYAVHNKLGLGPENLNELADLRLVTRPEDV